MGRKRLQLQRLVDMDVLEREMRQARRDKRPRYLERLQALRLLAQGATREHVAYVLGRHPITVRAWIQAWNEQGLLGLQPDFKGDPRCKLTEAQIEALKADLRKLPSDFGYLSGLWDARTVQRHIEKTFGVTYHLCALYRSLKAWGITLRVPRPQSAGQDPKAVDHFWTETVPALARKKRFDPPRA